MKNKIEDGYIETPLMMLDLLLKWHKVAGGFRWCIFYKDTDQTTGDNV